MAEVTQGFRVSPQQKRLWPGSRSGTGHYACCTVMIEGESDPEQIRAALERLVVRHEILRTTYAKPPGVRTPVQVLQDDGTVEWSEETVDTDELATASALERLERRVASGPFDLERGPVLRATLVDGGDGARCLVLALPSLNADGPTLSLLRHELAELLSDRSGDEQEEVPIQYAQYAEWRAQLLDDPESEEDLGRWRKVGASVGTDARLAGERPVPADAPFDPDRVERSLRDRDAAELRKLAQREEVEVGTVLFAAWQALSSRLTGVPGTTVGVVLDGRGFDELAGVVGRLGETVPVPLVAAPEHRFVDLVRRAREELAEAYDSQEYFHGEEVLSEETGATGLPYVFELQELEPVEGDAARLRVVHQAVHGERFRVKLTCSDRGSALGVAVDYDPVALSAAEAGKLLDRYEVLLASALERPSAPLSALELLSDAEREELLVERNRTSTERPETTLHGLIEAQVDASPGDPAVVEGARCLTYAELDQQANRLARHLREAGVEPETLVGLHLGRSIDMLVALLAVSKAGGAYLPLDPLYPPQRLRSMVELARPRVLVRHGSLPELELPEGSVETVVRLDRDAEEIGRAASERPEVSTSPAQLAYVLFTSGSTGLPKGVMVPHAALVNYLAWASRAYGLAPGDRVPVHSPLGFDLTVTGLLGPLVAGATVVLLPDEEGVDSLAAALGAAGELALVKLTPVHLELLSAQRDPEGGAQVRSLVVGGEALDGETLDRWWRRSPETAVFNEYGPTETVVGVSVHEASAQEDREGPVPVGRPIANVRLYLLDPWARPVPEGLAGELWVGGDCVARGYLGRPAQTAERFVPDPFGPAPGGRLYRTGDLMAHGPDGALRFLGRTDQQLKIRGVRVEPAEVEAALEGHPAVRDAVVVGWEDAGGDRRLVAYLLTDADETPEDDELRPFLAERLAEPMVPSFFVWMENYPLTAHGKVDRARLPPPGTQRPDLKGAYVAPRTPLEEVLAAVWGDVLGLDRVGVEDTFFALGGDSIRSVRLVAAAKERGLDFTVQELFRHQTIARLAHHLDGVLGDSAPELADGTGSAELEELVGRLEEMTPEQVRERIKERLDADEEGA